MHTFVMTAFRLLLLATAITGFSYGNTGIARIFNNPAFAEEKATGNIAQFVRAQATTGLSAARSGETNYPDNLPTTMETARLQLSRLMDKNIGSLRMTRRERFLRIIVGWSLLLAAKCAALASPLYFRSLVNQGKLVDDILATSSALSLDAAIQSSALGLIIGYGSAKLTSGFVQLTCELILSSATVSAAETLPKEAFTAALQSASRRWDDGVVGAKPTVNRDKGAPAASNLSPAAAASQDEGRSGFARRALDRGLRASNQFLYRSIFNLLPAFVETICVVCMMMHRAGMVVGLTAAAVAYSFVGLTMFVMKKRIPILRRQLRDEGIANGCAEDALSLAETVASFGAIDLEEERYANALARVSKSSMKVRYSFSLLKLMQSIILGVGAGTLIMVTWRTSTADFLAGSTLGRGSVAGQLVLVQSLFAQLCSPLDHVGQHFRDCVSAAEDLRDLESLKRVLATPQGANKNDNKNKNVNKSKKSVNTDINDNQPRIPKIFRQYGGADSWSLSPARMEMKNLIFSYPSVSANKLNNLRDIKPILNNISFIIPPGGYSLGIVGPSGSGKSTILRILLGLEPIRVMGLESTLNSDISKDGTEVTSSPPGFISSSSSSSVYMPTSVPIQLPMPRHDALPNAEGVLCIDGMDVSGYDRVPCFAMAGQDSDLFRGLSLVDNVRYGTHTTLGAFPADSHEARTALDNAAEDAQLEPLLQRLQGGWDGAVGPRGRLLSGGERQRVCLARALYREELNGGILLMDEVTASLDAKTESLVTNAVVKRVKKGATAILIAHRLSSVQHCDLVLVMKDGEIVERGTHTQLIKRAGWYAESWKLQSQSR